MGAQSSGWFHDGSRKRAVAQYVDDKGNEHLETENGFYYLTRNYDSGEVTYTGLVPDLSSQASKGIVPLKANSQVIPLQIKREDSGIFGNRTTNSANAFNLNASEKPTLAKSSVSGGNLAFMLYDLRMKASFSEPLLYPFAK